MSAKYVGLVVLEVDGQEIEVISINEENSTGRQLVKGMNSTGRAKGYRKGIETYDLSITAAVPIDGHEVNWAGIENAKLTKYPLDNTQKRVSYLDCFTIDVSEQYGVEDEAKIDIKLGALRKVYE